MSSSVGSIGDPCTSKNSSTSPLYAVGISAGLLVPFRPVNRGLHDGTHNARSGRHRARASVVLCVLSGASLPCSGAPLWSQRDECDSVDDETRIREQIQFYREAVPAMKHQRPVLPPR